MSGIGTERRRLPPCPGWARPVRTSANPGFDGVNPQEFRTSISAQSPPLAPAPVHGAQATSLVLTGLVLGDPVLTGGALTVGAAGTGGTGGASVASGTGSARGAGGAR